MAEFPSLTVEGVTITRVVCGTNALLGYSHVSPGRDTWIREHFTAQRIARVFAKCIELGVTAVMGPLVPRLIEALDATERLTGVRMTWVSTTNAGMAPTGREAEMREARDAGNVMEAMAIARESTAEQVAMLRSVGAPICFFHGGWIDRWPMVEGRLAEFGRYTQMIRDAGMVPAAVSHFSQRLSEVAQGGYDLAILGTPVNLGGWNMRPSRDEAVAVIANAGKPVLAIKTLACGRFEEHHMGDWLRWAVDVPGVQAIALGLMVEQEAEESIPLLRECFSRKFGE